MYACACCLLLLSLMSVYMSVCVCLPVPDCLMPGMLALRAGSFNEGDVAADVPTQTELVRIAGLLKLAGAANKGEMNPPTQLSD
jgi:hypothetical protein